MGTPLVKGQERAILRNPTEFQLLPLNALSGYVLVFWIFFLPFRLPGCSFYFFRSLAVFVCGKITSNLSRPRAQEYALCNDKRVDRESYRLVIYYKTARFHVRTCCLLPSHKQRHRPHTDHKPHKTGPRNQPPPISPSCPRITNTGGNERRKHATLSFGVRHGHAQRVTISLPP